MQSQDYDRNEGFRLVEEYLPRDGEHGESSWAVPWADLMMVMFVLFVVLYVYAVRHKDVTVVFGGRSTYASSPLDGTPLQGLIGRIAAHAGVGTARGTSLGFGDSEVLFASDETGVSVLRGADGSLKVSLRGDVFFADGGAALKPSATAYLDELSDLFGYTRGNVHVIGYASAGEAGDGDSFELSAQRAVGVARYLIDRDGLDPKRVAVSGRGAFRPEVPATSADNRAKNRRVEILLLNES